MSNRKEKCLANLLEPSAGGRIWLREPNPTQSQAEARGPRSLERCKPHQRAAGRRWNKWGLLGTRSRVLSQAGGERGWCEAKGDGDTAELGG